MSWDATDLGVLVWDEEFTIAPEENQAALIEFCEYLEIESELVLDNQVDCWIKRMDEFVRRDTANAMSLPIADEG